MEFEFKNFGKAGSGVMHINDLTVICGPNNSGKTYLNYAVHSILWDFLNLFDFGINEDDIFGQIQQLSTNSEVRLDLSKTLLALMSIKTEGFSTLGCEINKYFQVPKENFLDTEIFLKLDEIILSKNISDTGDFILGLIQYNYEFVDGKCTLYLHKIDDNLRNDFSVIDYLKDSKNLKFIINRVKMLIFRFHFFDIVPWPYALTAERSGISLFYKLFDDKNSDLLRSLDKLETSDKLIQLEQMNTKLFHPTILNIKDFRNFYISKDKESFIIRDEEYSVTDKLSELIDYGSYELRDEEIYFRPSTKLSNKEPVVPLHATSSSLKSFFSLSVFIKHVAEKNRMLIIDEPELNLFIDKQVMFARLVARLVNVGVKVLVTTHSDYFLREINNLITVNNLTKSNQKEIMTEFEILKCDLLDESRVSAYKTGNGEIKELKSSSVGIDPSDWNSWIDYENYKFDKIYFSPRVK